jgi:hypothetical protein
MRSNELCDPVQSLEFVIASERRILKNMCGAEASNAPLSLIVSRRKKSGGVAGAKCQSTMGRGQVARSPKPKIHPGRETHSQPEL